MQTTLATVLALASALTPAVTPDQTTEVPLDEIIVSGEYAGPGMWQITHPEHPGHSLWIVGEPPPLPKRMRWHSQKVERVAVQSQEIVLQPGVSLKPDEKVGVFRMLSLVPAVLKLRKNPDKATLQDLIPPDTYARWLVQKKLYLGRDQGVEKMRPFLVAEKLRNAAFKELQVGGGGAVWAAIGRLVGEKKIPVTQPNREFTFATKELRGKIKAFSREKLDDADCLAKTVELTEALSNKQVEEARANAWATGDLARLQELPPLPDPDLPCFEAIVNSAVVSATVPADLREQMDEMWFAAAISGLTKNESTLAVVELSKLLGDQGYLESLRKRGYEILAPTL
ncbi:MAG TPA: TraB/GumN family protein [Steroidobacteraceae bacterium]|nr:TraB/GumN family protein [Steroidobacteraceae bacterium]